MKEYKDYYLSKTYFDHMYTGIIGILMKLSHKKMEMINDKQSIILEIGAGTKPHIEYLKHDFDEYHIVDLYDELNEFYKKFNKVKYKKYDGRILPFENNSFNRIIISHCLEHIPDPEQFLLEMFSKLKPSGILSIALPNDPGILWRLGRSFGNLFINKHTHKMNKLENDYMNAKEHINSIFNLRTIIKKNFKNNLIERYEPFKIKSVDLNIFYIVNIIKK